jgi:hypothetical protein
MNALIRLLYAVLIAISVAVFIGVGVYSFYQGPKAPEYPATSYSSDYDSSAYKAQTKEYDQKYKDFQQAEKDYQRNVTYILIPLALASVAAGTYLFRRNDVIGEGLALGGVATSIYAIITASISEVKPLLFVTVTLLLVSVLVTAQQRFADKKH